MKRLTEKYPHGFDDFEEDKENCKPSADEYLPPTDLSRGCEEVKLTTENSPHGLEAFEEETEVEIA